jgi:mycothiol system anti-sigma-R factor
MMFYLDGELQGRDREMIGAHLEKCAACRESFDAEERFLRILRAARPRYEAPARLRARIEEMLRDLPSAQVASPSLRRRMQTFLWPPAGRLIPQSSYWLTAMGALVFTVALAWWFMARTTATQDAPSRFAVMAVDVHQRHLRDQLPLEVSSAAPHEVSTWFSGKVPFSVELPNFQEISGHEKLYTLKGARLVGYQNDYAAYVAYQMQGNLISLVITSDTLASPEGGEKFVSKGIPFHYNSIRGLKVITWSHRGLTYALVSDLEERGQQSCLVCHQGTTDRDFVRTLKPR